MNLFSYFESASDGDALVMPEFYCNIIKLDSQHVSCEILVFFCALVLPLSQEPVFHGPQYMTKFIFCYDIRHHGIEKV